MENGALRLALGLRANHGSKRLGPLTVGTRLARALAERNLELLEAGS